MRTGFWGFALQSFHQAGSPGRWSDDSWKFVHNLESLISAGSGEGPLEMNWITHALWFHLHTCHLDEHGCSSYAVLQIQVWASCWPSWALPRVYLFVDALTPRTSECGILETNARELFRVVEKRKWAHTGRVVKSQSQPWRTFQEDWKPRRAPLGKAALPTWWSGPFSLQNSGRIGSHCASLPVWDAFFGIPSKVNTGLISHP